MSEAQTPPARPDAATTPPARPGYVAPAVTTYTDAALLEALGPAQAQSSYFSFPGPG